MDSPVLYKISLTEYIQLLNDPMQNHRFYYEDSKFFPSHLQFKSENERTLFLLSWNKPKDLGFIARQSFGRALRGLIDTDVVSMYPSVVDYSDKYRKGE